MNRRHSRILDRQTFAKPGIRTKIYVRSDMIGTGKIDLLKALREAGSITGAAKSMGLGYRRAWFLLDTIQRCFGTPLFVTSRGGAQPSGTRLTPFGEDLIARYDAHIEHIQETSAEFLGWLEAHQRDPGDDEAD
jgi:molybdate transport system regulatory protein